MASIHETNYERSIDAVLRVQGESATLYYVDGTTQSITVAFNEQVGFVDERRRAVFVIKTDDLDQDIDRGDYFILSGETAQWIVIDVRDDKAGSTELRCDGTLERL